jgi:hypothetical protein
MMLGVDAGELERALVAELRSLLDKAWRHLLGTDDLTRQLSRAPTDAMRGLRTQLVDRRENRGRFVGVGQLVARVVDTASVDSD